MTASPFRFVHGLGWSTRMDQIGEQEAAGLDLPVLASERLTLRLVQPADAPALHGNIDDFDVVRMLARVPWPVARPTVSRFIEQAQDRAFRGDALELAILPRAGEAAGVVGMEYLSGHAHLGYWLGRAWWGRGLMTEAVSLVIRHVFAQAPKMRVVSGVFSDNPASLRVQEKLGFRMTGSHMRWCEARRADLKHIDTELTRDRFIESAR